MQEMEDKINNITSRHLAKALSYLDACELNPDIKTFIKREFWHTNNDIIEYIKNNVKQSKVSNEGGFNDGDGPRK